MQLQVEICPSKTFGFFWLCVDPQTFDFCWPCKYRCAHKTVYDRRCANGRKLWQHLHVIIWFSNYGRRLHTNIPHMRTYLVFGVSPTTFDIVLEVGYTFAALIPTVVRQWEWGTYHLPIHSHPIACVTSGAFCDLSAWNETCCLSV